MANTTRGVTPTQSAQSPAVRPVSQRQRSTLKASSASTGSTSPLCYHLLPQHLPQQHHECSEWRPTHMLSRSQLCSVVTKVAATVVEHGDGAPSEQWLAQAAEQARPHLRSLPPRTLSALLLAFVTLGYHPGDDWMADFDTAVVSHPQRFDPSSITDILSGLAALGTCWARFPEFVALRLSSVGQNKARVALDEWNYGQLSLTLRCLTCFGFSLEDKTLEVVGVHMAQKLSAMHPSELQSVLAQELTRPSRDVSWSRGPQFA